MSRLESELLRTFLAIVDAGSVTRGATRIHRSQSAASLQLKQLEDAVGQALLKRHGRGVIPTAAGEQLIPVARQVTGVLDAAMEKFQKGELSGRISMGVSEGLVHDFLPEALSSFTERHPRVELELHCALGDSFRSAVAEGKLDLAVYDAPGASPNHELLQTRQLVWLASDKLDVSSRSPLPIAVFNRACWWRDAALNDLSEAQIPYNVVFSSESVAGVHAAVHAGIAAALLDESSKRGGLRKLSTLGRPTLSSIILDSRPDSKGPAFNALQNAIRDAFRSKNVSYQESNRRIYKSC